MTHLERKKRWRRDLSRRWRDGHLSSAFECLTCALAERHRANCTKWRKVVRRGRTKTNLALTLGAAGTDGMNLVALDLLVSACKTAQFTPGGLESGQRLGERRVANAAHGTRLVYFGRFRDESLLGSGEVELSVWSGEMEE